MKQTKMTKTLDSVAADVEALAARMRADRRAKISGLMIKMSLEELTIYQTFWNGELKRLAPSRLRSDMDREKYRDVVEILELVTDRMRNYRPENARRTASDGVLSVRDTAKYLGVSESIVRQKIKRSEIPYVKIEGQYKFFMPVLQRWLSEGSVAASSCVKEKEAEKIKQTTDEIWTKTTEK